MNQIHLDRNLHHKQCTQLKRVCHQYGQITNGKATGVLPFYHCTGRIYVGALLIQQELIQFINLFYLNLNYQLEANWAMLLFSAVDYYYNA